MNMGKIDWPWLTFPVFPPVFLNHPPRLAPQIFDTMDDYKEWYDNVTGLSFLTHLFEKFSRQVEDDQNGCFYVVLRRWKRSLQHLQWVLRTCTSHGQQKTKTLLFTFQPLIEEEAAGKINT